MAIRNILRERDPALRKKSKPVTEFNKRLWTMLDDMAETMQKATGAGLAAPQVGVLRRAVVVDVGEGLIEMINPVIETSAGEIEDLEGCLSSPGEYGYVKRPETVTVKFLDRHGNPCEKTGEGFLARAFCHELDHLDGVLFKDKAIRMATKEELEKQK